jgi:hypothetical protein
MTTYVSPYTGQTINPSQVGYESLSITADTALQWPINGNTTNVVANIIDVTASVGSLKLYLAAATEVSTGQSVLFRNVGSNTFTVVDSGGNTIVSVASGIAQYVYLTDNSTVNGVWASVTFGAGTSSANASALAGYGLKAIGTTLNTVSPVTTFSSSYTFVPADQSSMYVWTSGAGTATMPSAASVGANWYVIIKNNGTGTLSIAMSGANTIDGNSSAQLQIGESFVVASNGSNWYSYAYGRSATYLYTQSSIVVTGGTVTLTSAQFQSVVQIYTGTLTSDCTIILPSIVQIYFLQNKTTSGGYKLTFKTVGSGYTTLELPVNQTIIAICDSNNVYNAQTSTSSSLASLSLGDGAAATPSLSFTTSPTTGLYRPASDKIGFAIAGSNAATLQASGLLVPVGILGGAF